MTNLVPQQKQQSIRQSGELGMGIGNLTLDEFLALQNTLSFSNPVPPPAWVMEMFQGGHSLGVLVAIFGTGVREVTMST